jgi:RNA-binding protein YhbY
MKISEFKNLIREEINNVAGKQQLREGVVDKIIAAIIDKVVKVKYGKYFDSLHKDPEYIEALKGVKTAADRINMAGERAVKAKQQWQKTYDAYSKQYGKKAADRIVAQTKAGTYDPFKLASKK